MTGPSVDESAISAENGLFAGFDSSAGAYFSARTAFDACVGVNVVDFAFRNSFYGANGETGAASNTSVSNYICHN